MTGQIAGKSANSVLVQRLQQQKAGIGPDNVRSADLENKNIKGEIDHALDNSFSTSHTLGAWLRLRRCGGRKPYTHPARTRDRSARYPADNRTPVSRII